MKLFNVRPLPHNHEDFHHHEAPHPIPHGPGKDRNLISVLYSEEEMKGVYGERWVFEVDSLAKEPPEMKVVYALVMGFQVALNRSLTDEERDEKTVDFPREVDLGSLAERIGLPEDVCGFIISKAPDGVVSIIKALLVTREEVA